MIDTINRPKKNITVDELKKLFSTLDYLDIVLLFGSHAVGRSNSFSDYDFAVTGEFESSWEFAKSWIDIASLLDLSDEDIDVINLKNASKLLKSSIKEGYIVLKGEKSKVLRLLGSDRKKS
jgi:predicted nucleotidyltransferase